MKSQTIYFEAPYKVAVRLETIDPPSPDHVMVQTHLSAISPGSEMLVYRGEFPQEIAVDVNIPTLTGEFQYPIKYGYSAIGRVLKTGANVDRAWLGKMVFSFHPHQSHFLASPAELIPVPEGISIEDAVFLPNMETAVNLSMDGVPLIGEHVVVFGQGIVGLLTTALLAQFPLASLITYDRHPKRRQASLQLGASDSLDPAGFIIANGQAALQLERQHPDSGADLVIELSGDPAALAMAIASAGYAGRVVVGSWYGKKRASLDLGSKFHRSRIQLISSQVSTIAPALRGRWDKTRRINLAWDMIRRIKPSRLITQHYTLDQAGEAYLLIDQHPEKTIQIVLDY